MRRLVQIVFLIVVFLSFSPFVVAQTPTPTVGLTPPGTLIPPTATLWENPSTSTPPPPDITPTPSATPAATQSAPQGGDGECYNWSFTVGFQNWHQSGEWFAINEALLTAADGAMIYLNSDDMRQWALVDGSGPIDVESGEIKLSYKGELGSHLVIKIGYDSGVYEETVVQGNGDWVVGSAPLSGGLVSINLTVVGSGQHSIDNIALVGVPCTIQSCIPVVDGVFHLDSFVDVSGGTIDDPNFALGVPDGQKSRFYHSAGFGSTEHVAYSLASPVSGTWTIDAVWSKGTYFYEGYGKTSEDCRVSASDAGWREYSRPGWSGSGKGRVCGVRFGFHNNSALGYEGYGYLDAITLTLTGCYTASIAVTPTPNPGGTPAITGTATVPGGTPAITSTATAAPGGTVAPGGTPVVGTATAVPGIDSPLAGDLPGEYGYAGVATAVGGLGDALSISSPASDFHASEFAVFFAEVLSYPQLSVFFLIILALISYLLWLRILSGITGGNN